MGSWFSTALPSTGDASVDDLVKACNSLGFDVLGEKKENFLCSPLSLYVALATAIGVFGGETRAELERSLGFSEDEAVASVAERLVRLCALEESPTLSMYSQCVVNPNFGFDKSVLRTLREEFKLNVAEWSFPEPTRSKVNKAVEKATRGMIKDLVDCVDASCMCLLVNSVYFEGKWLFPFSKYRDIAWYCHDGSCVDVPGMIVTKINIPFYEDEKCMSLSVPYGDDRSMALLVPKSEMGAMTHDLFVSYLPTRSKKIDKLIMPKWEFELGVRGIKEAVESRGVKLAFSEQEAETADGKHGLWISAIIHKTKIIVDELGTKAAAATAVVMVAKGGIFQPRIFTVVVDRPFYYAILNQKTGVLEFLGYLALPRAPPKS